MNVASAEFLIFTLISVIFYYAIPVRYRWFVLLLSSIAFIMSSNGLLLVLVMLITTTVTYFAGVLLAQNRKKWILAIALLINMGVLIFFKEINFFVGTTRGIFHLMGGAFPVKKFDILAPLGISYYTLNMVSYLLDLYWGIGVVQKNYMKFMLFAGYFPAMTSGPLLRYREIGEKLYDGHRFHYITMCHGFQRILWGFFKKFVLAERLAVVVNTIYGNYTDYNGLYIIIAMLCFTLQLYTDFSGCIDIVLGVSELFGIRLPENFDLPFTSKSVSEFWRRWHITLGAWLKDYVLYPILKSSPWQKLGAKMKKRFGKKYGKKIPVWLGLFLSWFLIGMWHGGAWNYIVGVGLLMWLFIVLGELCEPLFGWLIRKLQINTECFSWRLFQSVRTFCCFAIGLSLFRSYGGLMEGMKIWKSALSTFNPQILLDGSLLKLGLDAKEMGVLVAALCVLAISGILRIYLKRPLRDWLAEQNMAFRWIVLYILAFAVIIFGCYGIGYDSSAFIYEAF